MAMTWENLTVVRVRLVSGSSSERRTISSIGKSGRRACSFLSNARFSTTKAVLPLSWMM